MRTEAHEIPELKDHDRCHPDWVAIERGLRRFRQRRTERESGVPDWDEIYRAGKLHIGDEEFQLTESGARDSNAFPRLKTLDQPLITLREAGWLALAIAVFGFLVGAILL